MARRAPAKRAAAKSPASSRRPRVAGRNPRGSAPGARATTPAGVSLAEAVAAVREVARGLEQTLAEVPRPADFEPLAEHLYAFAQQAPQLAGPLHDLPRLGEPLAQSVRALQEVSETLQWAQQNFAEALLRLPRAEDYEPLAAPLREFARMSPALADALRELLTATSPLAALLAALRESVQGLGLVAASLEATRRSWTEPGTAPASGVSPELAAARRLVDSAREAVLEALASLPHAEEYAPAAAQLRELASVSPSLMEWMREVPALVTPLAESVARLRAAAEDLRLAKEALGREG